MLRSVVRGVGAYLPARVVSNDELSRRVDTSDAWIRERTGIGQRHLAAEGELTSDLAVGGRARRRWSGPGCGRPDVDLILVATSTPDHTFPATATAVQRKLGIGPRDRLRPAGGLRRLRLCPGDRRQLHPRRARPAPPW